MSAAVDVALRFTAVDPAGDAALVHGWMHQPHVAPWWQLAVPQDEVRAYLERQAALDHLEPWVVAEGDRPFAYVETYRAAGDPLARHYPARPDDLGWHVLVGPPEDLGTGLARRLGAAVLDRLFAAGASRVVCEPDVRNARMIAFCRGLGHEPLGELDLPDKRALLLGCER